MRIPFLDTHTGGEPTRVFFDVPNLVLPDDLQEAADFLHSQHDWLRTALLCEPRGNDVIVGALVLPNRNPESIASVIFMNNVGYLGMCGHGMIGVVAALRTAGKLKDGTATFDTPVGSVEVHIDGNEVQITNVASYRYRQGVELDLGGTRIVGDIAWGGNWFFLTDLPSYPLTLDNVDGLMSAALRIRAALKANGHTGANSAEIDHIEFARPLASSNSYQNFVLCPGGQFDRSPCGTGTSAKVACLAADGNLSEGDQLSITSIVGSQFQASFQFCDDRKAVIPRIVGSAFVMASGEMIIDPHDPFRHGFSTENQSVIPGEASPLGLEHPSADKPFTRTES